MDKGFTGVFQYPKQVLSRIASDLCGRYPEAYAEIFLLRRRNSLPQAHKGELTDVLPPFVRFCNEFFNIQVVYQPLHPYGMVCRVTCYCQMQYSPCRTRCLTTEERPNAMVLLTRTHGKAVALGSRKNPPTIFTR